MALKGLKGIFSPEDNDDESEEIVKTVSKDSKEFKNKTVLIEPRAFSEAQQIADYLKNNNEVIVNFKRVTPDVSKRIMDFTNGIAYAIEGSIHKVGPGIVLCSPKAHSVEGAISESDGKKSSKNTQELDSWE